MIKRDGGAMEMEICKRTAHVSFRMAVKFDTRKNSRVKILIYLFFEPLSFYVLKFLLSAPIRVLLIATS